jgi:hypothetical protein
MPHRDNVRKAFLIDRGERGLVRLAEKRRLLIRGKLNLRATGMVVPLSVANGCQRSAASRPRTRVAKSNRSGLSGEHTRFCTSALDLRMSALRAVAFNVVISIHGRAPIWVEV